MRYFLAQRRPALPSAVILRAESTEWHTAAVVIIVAVKKYNNM